jgi:hypothetical protein
MIGNSSSRIVALLLVLGTIHTHYIHLPSRECEPYATSLKGNLNTRSIEISDHPISIEVPEYRFKVTQNTQCMPSMPSPCLIGDHSDYIQPNAGALNRQTTTTNVGSPSTIRTCYCQAAPSNLLDSN